MQLADVQSEAFHFLARREVAMWANKLDPDFIVKQRDVARIPEELMELWKKQRDAIGHVAQALRNAFETADERERDWFLTWARCVNAQAVVRADLPRYLNVVDEPGSIPMALDSVMERAIFYVQKYLAHTMRMCPVCRKCFFQRRVRQKSCSKKCRTLRKNGQNRLYRVKVNGT